MNTSRDLKILEAILFASTQPVLESDLKEKKSAFFESVSGKHKSANFVFFTLHTFQPQLLVFLRSPGKCVCKK